MRNKTFDFNEILESDRQKELKRAFASGKLKGKKKVKELKLLDDKKYANWGR